MITIINSTSLLLLFLKQLVYSYLILSLILFSKDYLKIITNSFVSSLIRSFKYSVLILKISHNDCVTQSTPRCDT